MNKHERISDVLLIVSILIMFFLVIFFSGCQSTQPITIDPKPLIDAYNEYEQSKIQDQPVVTSNPEPAQPTGDNPVEVRPVIPDTSPEISATPDVFKNVVFLDDNVSAWPETNKLTVTQEGLFLVFTTEGIESWPTINDNSIAGNAWLMVTIGGKKYASTYEWIRNRKICRIDKSKLCAGNTKKKPFLEANWKAQKGDKIEVFLTRIARGTEKRNGQARTNVETITIQ